MLPAGLTARHIEIIDLLGQDMTATEVARALFLTPATVRSHLKRAYRALEVGSAAGAVGALIVLRQHALAGDVPAPRRSLIRPLSESNEPTPQPTVPADQLAARVVQSLCRHALEHEQTCRRGCELADLMWTVATSVLRVRAQILREDETEAHHMNAAA